MFPTCVTLTEPQLEKLRRFVQFLQDAMPDRLQSTAEEDVAGASPLTFEIYSTGIGDVIWVRAFEFECDLSIGDNGEIGPDEWEVADEAD